MKREAAIADADMRIGVQMDDVKRKFFGIPAVIGIEQCDIFASRMGISRYFARPQDRDFAVG